MPGIAKSLQIDQWRLRRVLFEQTGGMFPEPIARPNLNAFLPPVNSTTVDIIVDITAIADLNIPVAARVHDECNGSDVFGSDICTCRFYLAHGIEVCTQTAKTGKVTKFLIYNARKRKQGGDRSDAYFRRTECVAGVEDLRFQKLMPDVLHWLGIQQKILITPFASVNRSSRISLHNLTKMFTFVNIGI